MPNTDVINTTGALAFPYPIPVALLGAAGGGRPTVADASRDLIPRRVVQSAGGKRLDYAELEWALRNPMVNRAQPADFAQVIDVRLRKFGDVWPNSTGDSIACGDFVVESEDVSEKGEKLTAQCQVRGYHIGTPIKGMLVWNKLKNANEWIEGPILFNPQVDGRVLPNQSSKQRGGGLNSFLWAHPETSRTSFSTTWQGQSLSNWDLRSAIQTMCEAGNDGEAFVRNPDTAGYAVLSGAPVLNGVTLEAGKYLPEYLDRLLQPLGFNWFLKYLPDPSNAGATKPRITFFKRHSGPQKKVYFQMPGSGLDLSLSNCNKYSVNRSIGDTINEVQIFGAYVAREVTLRLYPMWLAADDGMSSDALNKTVSTSGYYSGKQLVWRAWGANEAGDLTGFRSDAAHQAGNPPDLTTVFPTWIPHNRTIEEPISMYGQDVRIPFYLEYSTDGGTTWKLCPDEFGAKLMPDRIGILFDADVPPEELRAAGNQARLRITGTVYGDSRLSGLATKQAFHVNGRTSRMTLYLEDKFQDRRVQRTGTFASTIPSSAADERNDTTAIQTYATELRDRNNGAEVDVEVRLPGIHIGSYEIGDLITDIEGRNISLNAASPTDPTPRYPQITEIRVEWGDKGPSTVLVLDRGTGD